MQQRDDEFLIFSHFNQCTYEILYINLLWHYKFSLCVSIMCPNENFFFRVQLYHRSVAPALCTFSLFLFCQGGLCFSTQTPRQIQRQDGGVKRESEPWKSVPLNLDLGLAFL